MWGLGMHHWGALSCRAWAPGWRAVSWDPCNIHVQAKALLLLSVPQHVQVCSGASRHLFRWNHVGASQTECWCPLNHPCACKRGKQVQVAPFERSHPGKRSRGPMAPLMSTMKASSSRLQRMQHKSRPEPPSQAHNARRLTACPSPRHLASPVLPRATWPVANWHGAGCARLADRSWPPGRLLRAPPGGCRRGGALREEEPAGRPRGGPHGGCRRCTTHAARPGYVAATHRGPCQFQP